MVNTKRQQAKPACVPGDEQWPEHLEAARRRAFLEALQAQVREYEQRYSAH